MPSAVRMRLLYFICTVRRWSDLNYGASVYGSARKSDPEPGIAPL